jgi:hypothetical protein
MSVDDEFLKGIVVDLLKLTRKAQWK